MESVDFVLGKVLPQSIAGLTISGLFYGWGAISVAIDERFNPDNPDTFQHQHGLFGAVIILFLSCFPMYFLQFLVNVKNCWYWPCLNEFQLQLYGTLITITGLFIGGVSLQYRSVWLYYFGCILPCGLGNVALFRRLVFYHQLWFKHIGKQNLGSSIFGFLIGLWTTIFFLVSVPMLRAFDIDKVVYIYSAFVTPFLLFCVFTIRDDISVGGSVSYNDNHHHVMNEDSNEPVVEMVEANNLDSSRSLVPTDCELGPQFELCPTNEIAVTESQVLNQEQEETILFCSDDMNNVATPSLDPKVIDWDNMDDEKLILLAKQNNIPIDADFSFQLTAREVISMPQTFFLFIFFTAILTPGWGIKLASLSMMKTLFQISLSDAATITSVYIIFYAVGRLLSGFLADLIGPFRTYDIIIVTMAILLVIVPSASTSMPHGGIGSPGFHLFVGLIWSIGFVYGAAVALFYSIVFDIFSTRNYRLVFSIAINGFGFAVAIGGISSAFSFSHSSNTNSIHEAQKIGEEWYYSMAGGCVLALLAMHAIQIVDYRSLLILKLRRLIDN